MSKDDFIEIKGDDTCPICGKGRRCKISGDGNAVVCFRTTGGSAAHRVGEWVRKKANSTCVVYVRNQAKTTRRVQEASEPEDLSRTAERYSERITADRVTDTAKELGVSEESLLQLQIGFTGQSVCFPERAPTGHVVGINRRRHDGDKKVGKGEKRGLTIPNDFEKMRDPVLIVEGASDTAACLTMGLTAVGRPNNVSGGGMLADLLDGREVLVVGERDEKPGGRWPGREGAIAIAEALAERWEKSVPWSLPPESCKDVREYLNEHKGASPRKLGRGLLKHLRSTAEQSHPSDKAERESIAPYRETERGFVLLSYDRDGNESQVPLTNFVAHIKETLIVDDGAESTTFVDIDAKLCTRQASQRFKIPAAQFGSLNWVIDRLGAEAVIYPGQTRKDHARVAIQTLSGRIPTHTAYRHLGWRRIEGQLCFLHAGGAIGQGDADVILEGPLTRFELPEPPSRAELQRAIRASLKVIDAGPDMVTVPVLSAAYRAVLGEADHSVYLTGQTGVFKTAFAAVVQQHFGAGLDAEHLPGSWESTDNALEATAFLAKDALLVVDDYVPVGGIGDQQRQNRKADRVLRGQANRQGRGRMRSDTTLRPAKYPRCLIVSTGEDLPRGQSLRARLFIVEFPAEDGIDPARLAACQRDASAGLYTAAMAGFIAWLAPQLDEVRRDLAACVKGERAAGTGQSANGTGTASDRSCKNRPPRGQEGRSGPVGPVGPEMKRETLGNGGDMHRRTSRIVRDLYAGLNAFLRFAVECKAITSQRADKLRRRAWGALTKVAAAQAAHQAACEPTELYINLLNAAISSGQAHIASKDGRIPHNARAFGWRVHDDGRDPEPRGSRIGWTDETADMEGHIYLSPEAAYVAAMRMGVNGSGLTISEHTLRKRLYERGLLARVEETTEGIRYAVREDLEGKRRRVLCLHAHVFTSGPVPPVPPVPEGPPDPSKPDSEPRTRDRSRPRPVPKPTTSRSRRSSSARVSHRAEADVEITAAPESGTDTVANTLTSAGFPASVLVLDFETFHDTEYSLTSLSVPQYVHDDRFHAFGVAVRWPDGRCEFRRDVEELIAECTERFGQGWKAVTVVGHNLPFDGYIARARYDVIPRYMLDTLSLARHVWLGWSNSLESLADRYGLPSKGDAAAQLKGVRELSRKQYAKLAAYAEHDAELTYDLLLKLLPEITRPEVELRLIDHTLRLFIERGVHLDMQAAEALRDAAVQQVVEVLSEARIDRAVAAGDRLVELLEAELDKHGEAIPMKPGKKGPIPALAKQDEGMKRLVAHKSKRVQALAHARLAVKSAPAFEKRISTLMGYASATGGVIPVPLSYYGAHTGRFSGSGGINLQNLPSRIDGPAAQLRGLIVPADGHRFVTVDADKIEARVLAWRAGQTDLVAMFAQGRDVYSEFASSIFGEKVCKPRPDDPPDLKAKLASRRQLGKTSILGLGYAMGWRTFIESVRNTPDLCDLLDTGTLTEEFLVRTHRTYRNRYRAIPRFWRASEAAFRSAIKDGHGRALNIPYVRRGDDVYVELPSQRRLIYRKAEVTPSGELSYVAERRKSQDGSVKETRKRVFGGLLAENIVQAISRDVLVDSMLKLEEMGYVVVLHVHDEVVLQVPAKKAEQALADAMQQLATTPVWAEGLPLDADGSVMSRYGK